MLEPIDGPSKTFSLSINATTPVEAKAGANSFLERKILTLQGDGKFYVYFADENEIPTSGNIISKGFIQYKDSLQSYEATGSQKIYLLSFTGTVTVRGAERA